MIASRRHTVILLLICAAISALTYTGSRSGHGASNGNRIGVYLGVIAAEWLLLRYTSLGVRRAGHTLGEIGNLRAPLRWLFIDLALAALLYAAVHGTSVLLHRVLPRYDDHTAALTPRSATEIVLWIAASLSAGICEELVFRGYLQQQFAAIFRGRWLAVVLQAVAFGFSHGYQGWTSMIVIVVIGLLFGLVAAIRGSVRPGIAAHAFTDIAGGLHWRVW